MEDSKRIERLLNDIEYLKKKHNNEVDELKWNNTFLKGICIKLGNDKQVEELKAEVDHLKTK